jgi:hypothetical protein
MIELTVEVSLYPQQQLIQDYSLLLKEAVNHHSVNVICMVQIENL